MKDELVKSAQEQLEHLAGACGIGCTLAEFNVQGVMPPAFCLGCPMRGGACRAERTHLYGCYEADRWQGQYIYYCPLGYIFIVAAFYDDVRDPYRRYGLAGPIDMSNADEPGVALPEGFAGAAPPRRNTTQVNDIASLLTTLGRYFGRVDPQAADDRDSGQAQLQNLLYEVSDEMRDSDEASYPISAERELMQMISLGDKSGSQELLNKLMGHIFFHSGADLEVIKARVIELIVLLSRASIDGGADVDKIIWQNNTYITDVQSFHSLEALSSWLTQVMHRFISYVFDFAEIKHADVLYKALKYIRQNYEKRLTLEEVAAQVYLSKSYLSKIFNDEMNCSFTNYINSLRIEKSKTLLLDSSADIIEIALEVGFDDQSYFTKVFKKQVGVAPGRFRETRGLI